MLCNRSKGILTRLLPLPLNESKVLRKEAEFEGRNVFGIPSERPEFCRGFWERLSGLLGKINEFPAPSVLKFATGMLWADVSSSCCLSYVLRL